MTQERYGRHVRRDPHAAARWIAPLGLLVACLACIAAWFVFAQPHGAEPADQGPATVALERESAVPTPVVKHPGNSPRLPGRRLHRHAGQRRPALPSRTVGELRRPGHHRHRRHRLQLRPAVRADAPVHREIGHRRMRVRNPHRPTRRPLHRLPGLQHPARGRRFRGPRRLHGLHTRHQPLLGSGRRGHPATHLHAGRPGHRPHRFLQHGGRILRAAAHRIAHRRRHARPGRRHRVPQRLHRRLRLACRPSARLRRPEP